MRGRGLPDDHAGPIRVVTIEGVDSNMCCGTHVSNLSDLQVSVEGLWSVRRVVGSRLGVAGESDLSCLWVLRATVCLCVCVCVISFVQVIKILGTEKGKKNKSNLIFLAGHRVLKWMERSHGREKALTTLLK